MEKLVKDFGKVDVFITCMRDLDESLELQVDPGTGSPTAVPYILPAKRSSITAVNVVKSAQTLESCSWLVTSTDPVF
jgi:hypothetical protein